MFGDVQGEDPAHPIEAEPLAGLVADDHFATRAIVDDEILPQCLRPGLRGHTRGDTTVYFPAAKVIVLGDLLTTHELMPPIVNYGDGGSWTEWLRSMDQILQMDWDRAVPGHGPMVTKAKVQEIRNRFATIMQRVRELNRAKKTQEEISAALMAEFKWAPANNIPGMIQELR